VAQPQAEHARRVVGYYRSPESRLAYRLLLGGTKHFGYYPEGAGRLSMTAAMRRMEDEVGRTLALPPGSRVLDAGCGEGDVAVRLGTRFGLEVDGVDLLEAFDFVVERSAMRSLPAFVHGAFPAILEEAGLEVVAVEDIGERIWPMLRRLARICALPAATGRLLRARAAVLNCTALVEGYRHREGWRYNVVRARRAR
jgi:SAM-dependent methyltransferase